MKKFFIFVLALAGLAYFGLLPFQANDVSKLMPVETVIVTRTGDQYRVDVGEGVRAIGKTLSEALDKLKDELSGIVFFQTAEQIIVQEQAAEIVREVVNEPRFRPAAAIYLTPESDLDANAVSRYLSARHTGLTLGEADACFLRGQTPELPRLISVDGGYSILA